MSSQQLGQILNVNQVAFCTTSLLGIATIATVIAAATSTAMVSTIFFSALALASTAGSIASITAWLDKNSVDVETYFTKMKEHTAYAFAGTLQFVAQNLFHALIQGITQGVGKAIGRKIGGEDITVKVVK